MRKKNQWPKKGGYGSEQNSNGGVEKAGDLKAFQGPKIEWNEKAQGLFAERTGEKGALGRKKIMSRFEGREKLQETAEWGSSVLTVL